jgi:hypothetical protein
MRLNIPQLPIHVRFGGRSEDLTLSALDLSPDVSDQDLLAALARHYDCSLDAFADYVVIREPQAFVIRPIAYYA